jgi:histidine ammonia-lyase
MIRIAHDVALTTEDVVAVARGAAVEFDAATAALLDARRAEIVDHVRRTGEPAYGFNRGFGQNVDVRVPEDRLEALQVNLIRSHACGVGGPAPVDIVRAAVLLRAASLARGHSGVRSVVVQRLVDLLNHGITPVVPMHGSVGASGDLAPLAHIALALIGEGAVSVRDEAGELPATDAMHAAGIAPLALQMKEGLALINGSQFATALGMLGYDMVCTLLKTACIATAVTAQVWLGTDAPFSAELHLLRPHPGSRIVARWLWDLLQGSPLRQAHAAHELDWEVQDPYSLRCAAQILGTCHELLEEARHTFEVEANSVTDNPLLLAGADGTYTRIMSGGHFHGMPIAIRLHGIAQAAAIMATLSQARTSRYVDPERNKGLGADLIWPGLSSDERATASGMMIAEYTSAALLNTVWASATPSHLLSLVTSAGQEDHVSMSAGLGVRLWQTLPRVAEILAIELAYGSQGAAIRARSGLMPSKRQLTDEQRRDTESARLAYEEAVRRSLGDEAFDVDVEVTQRYRWPEDARRLSPVCERVVNAIRETVPLVEHDRPLSGELSALADRVSSGEMVALAEEVVPLAD